MDKEVLAAEFSSMLLSAMENTAVESVNLAVLNGEPQSIE